MSNVRLKFELLGRLREAVEAGALPKGCEFSGEVRQGTIWINVDAAPFDCYKDRCLTLKDGGGYTTTIALFGRGEDSSYTEEAEELKASVASIANTVLADRARFHVYCSRKWIDRQAAAKRAGTSLGALVGATHIGALAQAVSIT